jgi:hypothetical protein
MTLVRALSLTNALSPNLLKDLLLFDDMTAFSEQQQKNIERARR